ncbi:MAG: glycosyltransferase [Gemmatimonadetes bacterium]|nr:glycosyltransferase [Gemmatimonadota bacterium]
MKRAAVFTSPSRHEGMPNAVVEAMTCGCALVVSDIPSHREILDAGSARFVSPDDPAALAAAVAGLLDAPAEASGLGRVARARAAQWSVEASMRAYLALYQELAAGAAR